MFTNYPAISKALRNSKFISYSFRTDEKDEHFVNYIYEDSIKRWIPLQSWEGLISLADWMAVFDAKTSMESLLQSFVKDDIDPITYPHYYWSLTWNLFIKEFR
jgi:hypothetical protein